jgi:hypothetical protein
MIAIISPTDAQLFLYYIYQGIYNKEIIAIIYAQLFLYYIYLGIYNKEIIVHLLVK